MSQLTVPQTQRGFPLIKRRKILLCRNILRIQQGLDRGSRTASIKGWCREPGIHGRKPLRKWENPSERKGQRTLSIQPASGREAGTLYTESSGKSLSLRVEREDGRFASCGDLKFKEFGRGSLRFNRAKEEKLFLLGEKSQFDGK
jgi:hypothetical protein